MFAAPPPPTYSREAMCCRRPAGTPPAGPTVHQQPRPPPRPGGPPRAALSLPLILGGSGLNSELSALGSASHSSPDRPCSDRVPPWRCSRTPWRPRRPSVGDVAAGADPRLLDDVLCQLLLLRCLQSPTRVCRLPSVPPPQLPPRPAPCHGRVAEPLPEIPAAGLGSFVGLQNNLELRQSPQPSRRKGRDAAGHEGVCRGQQRLRRDPGDPAHPPRPRRPPSQPEPRRMPERILVSFPTWRQTAVASNHWGGEGQSGLCIRYIIYLCSSFLPISVSSVPMGCIPLEPLPPEAPAQRLPPLHPRPVRHQHGAQEPRAGGSGGVGHPGPSDPLVPRCRSRGPGRNTTNPPPSANAAGGTVCRCLAALEAGTLDTTEVEPDLQDLGVLGADARPALRPPPQGRGRGGEGNYAHRVCMHAFLPFAHESTAFFPTAPGRYAKNGTHSFKWRKCAI